MNLVDPIFFTPNRVWREYTGGLLLDRFIGTVGDGDGHFPEDWLASTARADNGENSQREDEGLVRICGAGTGDGPMLVDLLAENAESILGAEHVAMFGKSLAMQCKLIDLAVPQPIQYYPAPSGGSTEDDGDGCEAWYILGSRHISGGEPHVLVGVKEGVSAEAFSEAVKARRIEPVESMLHKLPICPGEGLFIPPHTPYAVEAGVFMLQVRRYADDAPVCPVTMDNWTDIPDCTGLDKEELLRKVTIHEHILKRSDEGCCFELIGSHQTGGFSLWRVEISGRMRVKLPRPFALVVCTAGEGLMSWAAGSRELAAGEYFLQPYGVPWVEYVAYGHLNLMVVLPPMS